MCLKNELKDCIDNGKSLHPYLSLGRLWPEFETNVNGNKK